jgi:hypothetical protein
LDGEKLRDHPSEQVGPVDGEQAAASDAARPPSYRAGFHKRLSFKLARTGVIIAFILGVGLSAAQVYIDYSNRFVELAAEVDRLLKVSAPTAERAVHLLDEELANEVVQGLMEYKFRGWPR